MSTVVTLGPVGFKPTGAYDNTREYKKLDVVIYQGSSYIAKSDSIGQLPTNTTYWELLVQKGDTGEKGEKGDPGEVTEEQLDEAMARANMVYNALPKVSDEGDNLTLDGTANCPMKMELKGNTEQTTYTGKNLLPNSESLSNTGQYQDVIKFTDLEPSTEYTLKVKGTAGDKFYTGGSMPYSSLTIPSNGVLEFTFTTNSTISDRAIIKNTTATNTLPLTECTLCKGSTATYEPYVGGTPSPSPDYPQDVRVVTGNNSVKVIGKNLYGAAIKTDNMTGSSCNIITDTSNKLEIQGIINFYSGIYKKYQLKPNTQYTISLKYSEIGNNSRSRIYYKLGNNCENITIVDNNGNIDIGTTTTSLTFTTDNTGLVAILFCCNWTTNTGYIVYNDIQLEQGSATTYEPYQSQTYPINLGTMELCKIRGYQDYIAQDIIFHAINGDSFYDTLDNATKQTLTYGKWYKHSEICKVVLDGSDDEGWSHRAFPDQSYLSVKRTMQIGAAGGFCNYFINNYNYDVAKEHMTISKQWRELCFAILKSRLSTGDEAGFKSWLSTNTPIVYYILETPTNTEITDTTLISQLNAIENAVSYATQTNIVQENYSEPFIINAECVRSLKDIFELIQ